MLCIDGAQYIIQSDNTQLDGLSQK